MKVIDLFCGAGGFSHGFQMEGFEIVLGIDNWKGCEETYRYNHPNADFWLKDIRDIITTDLPEADVVIGSPPCTNFSRANLKRDESKGYELVDIFLEIVRSLNPRYWIMENVAHKGLIDHLDGYPKMIVKCSDFGLPTIRRRLFCGEFPQPMSMGIKSDAVPSINTKDPYTQSKKTDWAKHGVYPTVTGQMRDNWASRSEGNIEAFKKKGITSFTPQFAAYIQTFPDDFKFIGSKTSKYKMIGNAVPPEMARILARAIKEDNDE